MKKRKLNSVEVFDIQNLPDVPFRRVLDFYSAKDTRKLRCLISIQRVIILLA